MKKLTLDETYKLLKKYKHVVFDEDTATMATSMIDEGLVLKLKNKNGNTVMLFPKENNQSVSVTETSVTLHDVNNWCQIFEPLIVAQLC